MTKQEIKELVNKHHPMVLDVGCYDGKDSLALSQALNCDVHCFEPDPLSQDLFTVLHGNNPRLHLYPYALTDVDGETDFYQSNHPQSNSIKEPKLHLDVFPGVKFDDKIKVKTRRLDSWHTGEIIDFIWADVNGAERGFIMGGLKALSFTRYLYTEAGSKELYAGQANVDSLVELLPGWKVMLLDNWGENYGNVLLKNMRHE